jgi:hypothetical protein
MWILTQERWSFGGGSVARGVPVPGRNLTVCQTLKCRARTVMMFVIFQRYRLPVVSWAATRRRQDSRTQGHAASAVPKAVHHPKVVYVVVDSPEYIAMKKPQSIPISLHSEAMQFVICQDVV